MPDQSTTPTTPSEKRCTKCGQTKPLDEFYRNTGRKDGRGGWCKPCHLAISKKCMNAAYKRDPEKFRERRATWRATNLETALRVDRTYSKTDKRWDGIYRRKYGITVQDYAQMSLEQGGVCAICQEACRVKSRLAVDHCHVSGKVRGLLCDFCNNGLGRFRDNPRLLINAALYLSAHQETPDAPPPHPQPGPPQV